MVSELAAETVKIGNTYVRSSWTDTETDKNGKKEALHIVICVSETIVKGKHFGENCVRLKADIRNAHHLAKQVASFIDYSVIFETKNLKFRFRTPDGNSTNYKLWLGNDSGTQNNTRIREVLAQLDRSQGMALGGMCKQLSDSSWLAEKLDSVKENTRNYRIDRKIFKKIKLGSAVTNWANTGLSCYSSVRKKIANIELASISREEANKICSFELQFAYEDKNIDLRAIQKGLKRRSLYEGAVDGVLGKGSCAAFNKFMACENTSRASFSRQNYLSLLSKNISNEKQSCYDGKSTTTIAAKAVSKNGLEGQIESLQNTIDSLRSENKNLKQTLVEKKKVESSGQENLRRELEDLRSEYESLKSKISYENKGQAYEAKQTIDELKAQIVELKEDAKKPKKDEQNLVYMATAIANLQKEIAEKEIQGSKQDEKIKKLDAEIEKIEKEKAALKVAIQSLESLLVTKDDVIADKDELYSELESRFQSSKNDIKKIQNQYNNKLATKSEEIDRLNNILSSVQQLVSNTSQLNITEDPEKNTISNKESDSSVSGNQESAVAKNAKQESPLFPIDPIEGAAFCHGFLIMIYEDKYFSTEPNLVKLFEGHAFRHFKAIGLLGEAVISQEKSADLIIRGGREAKEFMDQGIGDNTIAKGQPFRSITDHCITLDALKEHTSKSSSNETEKSSAVAGSFPSELEGLYWVANEEVNSSNLKTCKDIIAHSKEMVIFHRFYPDKTYVALKAGAGNKYGKNAEFDGFLKGSNKVTNTGKIMQFKSIQIQPGNVRQTILYEYNSELSRLEYVKGIECKNCEGGVKIGFDRLNEKSDLYYYWCIGRP